MRYARSWAWIGLIGHVAMAGAAWAAPLVGVTPGTVDRRDPSSIEITVGGLTGGELWLRLYVDADGDGVLGEPDYVVWADRVRDNAAQWSPAMPVDEESAAGTVTLNLGLFGPLGLPRTAGRFLWHAADPADGSFATVPFTVIQSPSPWQVSGRVFDDGLSPLAGALVLLQPIDTACGESILSAIADPNGDYAIDLPAEPTCGRYVARASRPGAFATLADSAVLDLTADALAGVDLRLRTGTSAAQATVTYATGDRAGEGVAGITLFAATSAGSLAVAFTDIDGSYALGLDDIGDIDDPDSDAWTVRVGAASLPQVQGVVYSVDHATAPGSDVALPAANAFVHGRLTDDTGAPLAGATVVGRVNTTCAGDCWTATGVTTFDGRYVLGFLAPPAVRRFSIEPAAPLAGRLAARRDVELRAGDAVVGIDLDHIVPTGTVVGTVLDTRGAGVAGRCLRATGPNGARVARGRTACDGSYVLPALDGEWDVRLETDTLAATVLRLEPGVRDEQVLVTAAGATLDLVLRPPTAAPFLRTISPAAGPSGTHVVLEGGNFGDNPVVTFDGVVAQKIAVRPDLGQLVVKIPTSLAAGVVTVEVRNAQSLASNEQCFEMLPGRFAPTCGISGTITRGGGALRVEGALVVAFDPVTEVVERVDVTDDRGRYDLGLDDAGANYGLRIYSPRGNPLVTGRYPALPCPVTRNHNLRSGRLLAGRVRDAVGPIAAVRVDARGVLASGTTLTRDDGSFTLRVEEGDNVTITFAAPPGSRWINDQSIGLNVPAGPTELPDVVLTMGRLVTGHVVDAVEAPLAATIRAGHRGSGDASGASTTNTCDGSFALAVDDGEHRLQLASSADGAAAADVEWAEVDGDGRMPFAFTLSAPGPLAFAKSGPRLNDETSMAGRVGQAVALGVENLTTGVVQVLFVGDDGTTVAGEHTVADPGRGLVFTRVPAGATSGSLVLRADAVASPPSPFTVLEEPFLQGGFVLGGQAILEIDPVEGVLALLFLVNPDGVDCSPIGRLHDFDVSDASGRYDLRHPGGDMFVLLLPPRQGSRLSIDERLTLAPIRRLFRNEFGNRVFGTFFVDGTPFLLRAVTGSPPRPVPNARVTVSDGVPDFGITGPNGVATLYVKPEFSGPVDVDVRLLPPFGSRLMLSELRTTAPNDLGDVTLAPGVFVAGQVTDDDGTPLVEVTVGGFASDARVFDTVARRDGVWRGPVPATGGYAVVLQPERFDVADAMLESDAHPARDRIALPGMPLAEAGILAGSVRDAATGEPIDGAAVTGFAATGTARGAPTAFAETCNGGEFRAKVAEGLNFINVAPADPQTHFSAWYSRSGVDFCPLDAQAVIVDPGTTTGAVDVTLDPRSTIAGRVSVFDSPAVGVRVTATLGRLGSCEVWAETGREGDYALSVPAGSGYRIESAPPLEVGGPSQCYQGLFGCPSFTAVATVPQGVTAEIDFTFVAGPQEVAATEPLLLDKADSGGDELILSFARLPPDASPDGYNVYGGKLGDFDAAVEVVCFVDPLELGDDGNGIVVYVLTPDPAAEWFLVSASNAAAESSLGPNRALDNACGAMPPP